MLCCNSSIITQPKLSQSILYSAYVSLEQGCEWNVEICSKAIGKSSVKCLKYIHERGLKLGGVCNYLAFNGRLDMLKYAFKNGYKMTNKYYETRL